MNVTHDQPSFHVGDQVKVDFGRRTMTGTIVEDRGLIGIQGRRLFRVSIPTDPFEPMTLELPEDEMEPVPTGESAKPMDKTKVMDYLVHGGLSSILRANLSGGRGEPRVWLCHDQLENVTHTFSADRGVVGGEHIPFFALHGTKVFTPKREAVLSFVESFGMNRRDAEKVVSEVGTAP
jgi:hypothetical protein